MNKESKLDKFLAAEFSEDAMDLKSKLKAITKKEISHKRSPLKILMPVLAIAASLILAIIFLPSLFHNSSDADLYASYYEPYPMALNQRGDGDASLNEAILLYSEGNYAEAAEKFEILYKLSGDNVHHLYAASAHQALGNYEATIVIYDDIISTSDPKVTEQAEWYKALALLKLGKDDAAKHLLKSLPSSHYKYSEAQEILK